MKQVTDIKQKNYERASQLLGKLFEVNSDITQQINCYIQHYGTGSFFKKLEAFDFSEDVLKKLMAVRMVLFGMGEERVMTDILKDVSDIGKTEKSKGGAGL